MTLRCLNEQNAFTNSNSFDLSSIIKEMKGKSIMIKENYYQKQVVEWLKDLESKVMIPIYGLQEIQGSKVIIQSYLIPNDHVKNELESDQPNHGGLVPGFTQYGFGESSEIVYWRYGNEDGVEPLICEICYDGLKDDTVELSEEFRQLFTLYYDKNKREYIHPQNDDRVVCEFVSEHITIDKKYLKSYLAAKGKVLVLNISGQIQEKITSDPYPSTQIPISEKDLIGSINIGNCDCKNYSQLFAKKIIYGCPLNQCNLWPFNEKHEYIDFIIGTDENGNEITHSCDPNTLSNFFGTNPNEPHYLTPIYFERTVLEKYIRQPERYSIESGLLSCGGLWSISIDNESPDYVSAYLGDLGRDLPSIDEQRYWRTYNRIIDGRLSKAKVNRDFFSIWSESEAPDIIFKNVYSSLNEKSNNVLGWQLFLELSRDDKYNFNMLRIPLRESQEEFDSLVLSLVKVLIDSLNEKEILKRIKNKDDLKGGISKLERWLEESKIQGFEDQIKFLRNLQELRSSGTGHRKGKGYDKISSVFELNDGSYKNVFAQILKDASEFLKYLDDNLESLITKIES